MPRPTFNSPAERPAEIRIGTGNAWKVWLNGKFVFGRDAYHRGAMLDQYLLPIQLRKGPNTLLVKCCQNEQKETWTVEWRFQLRICDQTGSAIRQAARSELGLTLTSAVQGLLPNYQRNKLS